MPRQQKKKGVEAVISDDTKFCVQVVTVECVPKRNRIVFRKPMHASNYLANLR